MSAAAGPGAGASDLLVAMVEASGRFDDQVLPDRGYRAVNPLLITQGGIDKLARAAMQRAASTDDVLAAALMEMDRTLQMQQEHGGTAGLRFPEGRITDALIKTDVALPALAWIALGRMQALSGLPREEVVQMAVDQRIGDHP